MVSLLFPDTRIRGIQLYPLVGDGGRQEPSAEKHVGSGTLLWPSIATEGRPHSQVFPRFIVFGAAQGRVGLKADSESIVQ